MAIPGIPSNFYVQQGNADVYLSWDITAGATSYSVQRSTDGVTFSVLTSPSTNYYLDTTVTVTTPTTYFYKVASVNSDGTSSYTAAQSVVPTFSGRMSLGQVRLLAQQRADRVNSKFVTLPEWNTYINQSYFELYDLLVTTYEDYYIQTPLNITTDGTTTQYDLSTLARDFYKLVGVDISTSASTDAWVTLKKFNFIERNRYVYPQSGANYLGVFNLQYRVVGSTLMMIPTPAANQTLRLWYIPRMTQLLQDKDILDGISGWTEYVVVDAARKALAKEESDTSVLLGEKMALKARIEETAMNRDAGQPDTISDTRNNSWGGTGYDGGTAGF